MLRTALTAIMCVGMAASAQTLDQDNLYPSVGTGVAVFSTGFQAQSFTVGLNGTLDRIDLNIWSSVGITGDELRLSIVDAPGGVPDDLANALYTQAIPFSDIEQDNGFPSPLSITTVDISAANLAVTAGEQYAIVLHRVGPGAPPWVLWGSGANIYADGSRWRSNTQGASWIETATADYGFATYVTTGGSGACSDADLSSPANPGTPDGLLSGADFFEFLVRFESGDLSVDFSSPANLGTPDGLLSGADFLFYLDLFGQGC